jgi:copper resistance protein D
MSAGMGLNGLLIALRTVHFASTVLLAGTVAFGALVVDLGPRTAREDPQFATWRRQTAGIAWAGLATAVLSGAAWLVVLAADIGGRRLHDVLADDLVWRVLTNTRFGFGWSVRFFLALLLALGLRFQGRPSDASPRWQVACVVALALSFLGGLAWSGHASGTPGIAGELHIFADVLHLIAAGIWVGGLLSLALLFAAARRTTNVAVAAIARDATRQFSRLGIIAVGALLVTGVINTCLLVGSVPALVGTDYGRLLVVKTCLFGLMVCVAAFNRQRLTPRLWSARGGADAQRQLQRNSLTEASMGVLILVIVGALGTLPPALHAMPSAHVHGQ